MRSPRESCARDERKREKQHVTTRRRLAARRLQSCLRSRVAKARRLVAREAEHLRTLSSSISGSRGWLSAQPSFFARIRLRRRWQAAALRAVRCNRAQMFLVEMIHLLSHPLPKEVPRDTWSERKITNSRLALSQLHPYLLLLQLILLPLFASLTFFSKSNSRFVARILDQVSLVYIESKVRYCDARKQPRNRAFLSLHHQQI